MTNHKYNLLSGDGTIDIQIQHNVRGRRIYAIGTLDAVRFFCRAVADGRTKLYSMFDILKSGTME